MRKRFTTLEFIDKSKDIHGNKYDYSKVEYINQRKKVTIICPEHGEFEQLPCNHYNNGCGCPKCRAVDLHDRTKTSVDDFIKKSIEAHGDRYDYSKVEYHNNKKDVCIICSDHGEFWQTPTNHYIGKKGCPSCVSSKGENEIRKILTENNISFVEQRRFDDCKCQQTLPFDFYLPESNTCIEYDGIQHFEPIEFWGGMKTFLETQMRDKIKTDFCKENNIELIRIRYDDVDIEQRLL
jgi:hypothetical protein